MKWGKIFCRKYFCFFGKLFRELGITIIVDSVLGEVVVVAGLVNCEYLADFVDHRDIITFTELVVGENKFIEGSIGLEGPKELVDSIVPEKIPLELQTPQF